MPAYKKAMFLHSDGYYTEEEGNWVWADVFDPDETCETHPENPNEHCFTRVWLPKYEEDNESDTH